MGLSDSDTISSAISGSRRDLSRTLSAIENGASFNFADSDPWTLGVTGPPGVGKSSLIGRLILKWVDRGERVAVLAVDPSSPNSGGALLADRMRMQAAEYATGKVPVVKRVKSSSRRLTKRASSGSIARHTGLSTTAVRTAGA